MAIQLKPRNYKPGLTWKVLPKNKIDTVACKPVVNRSTAPAEIYTEEITSVKVNGNTYSLPIADNVNFNRYGQSANYRGGMDIYFADGAVEVVMASGTFTLTVTDPLPELPTVNLVLEGTTKFINRGSKTFDQMWNLFATSTNFAAIISNNASGSESWTNSKSADNTNRGLLDDPTLVDYTKPDIPLFPFVRVVKAAGTDFNANKLTEEEVLTHWIKENQPGLQYTFAMTEDWSALSNPNAWLTWDTYQNTVAAQPHTNQRASFVNQTASITTEVIKVDDYTYTVNWTAPVRYAYYAASQYVRQAPYTRYDLDSYAFLDNVTKINAVITSSTINMDTVDLSYSLDSNDNITPDTLNNYPLSFDTNEFITLDAYIGSASHLWTTDMIGYILRQYKNGKYVVECDVYATWALDNNIAINTEIQVMLQNGEYIMRGSNIATFEVKNIKAAFKGSEFICTLSMLEV